MIEGGTENWGKWGGGIYLEGAGLGDEVGGRLDNEKRGRRQGYLLQEGRPRREIHVKPVSWGGGDRRSQGSSAQR